MWSAASIRATSTIRKKSRRAGALSLELGTTIAPGFEALAFKASRNIEDIYELTYICKDGGRFPAIVSVTPLRSGDGILIGYLLIGTDPGLLEPTYIVHSFYY